MAKGLPNFCVFFIVCLIVIVFKLLEFSRKFFFCYSVNWISCYYIYYIYFIVIFIIMLPRIKTLILKGTLEFDFILYKINNNTIIFQFSNLQKMNISNSNNKIAFSNRYLNSCISMFL